MKIRKTRMEELDRAMEIYEHARNYMRTNGNHKQWIRGYPSRELVEGDIKAGISYVCEEEETGALLAVFAYFWGEDATYRKIDGAWIGPGAPYGVVHRIGVDAPRRGVGAFCLDWALKACGDLRIDTHGDNVPMQNMLRKEGFSRCGIIVIEDGSERVAFEKLL